MKAIPDAGWVIAFPECGGSNGESDGKDNDVDGNGNGAAGTRMRTKVRADVVASMKRCLSRNPKERPTIPELLEQGWLAVKEPEPPTMREMLAPDETVITPYYMRQLLQYGIKLGEGKDFDMSPENLLKEAEVSLFYVFLLAWMN